MTTRRGVTLVEMVITVAIFSIIILAAMPLFNLSTRGLSRMEAHTSLKLEAQEAINRLAHHLAESKRLFENTSASRVFLSRAQLTTPPSVLSGSKLAILEETGGLSTSSSSFVTASVGNSLFFASIKEPVEVDVVNSASNTVTVRIDSYHFNYYFLTQDSTEKIGGKNKIDLWEWQSKSYASYDRIDSITDSTKKSNLVRALKNQGIAYAWNPSATNVSSAFYELETSGSISAAPAHQIPESNAKPLIKILTGISGHSFQYGVSPNTIGGFTADITVPQFASAGSTFPSGFEVVAVGPNSARQIFIRLVLVAQGAFKGLLSSEQTVLTTIRDLW